MVRSLLKALKQIVTYLQITKEEFINILCEKIPNITIKIPEAAVTIIRVSATGDEIVAFRKTTALGNFRFYFCYHYFPILLKWLGRKS